MVKILFAQIGHEYLMFGRCWRIEGVFATRRAGQPGRPQPNATPRKVLVEKQTLPTLPSPVQAG
jgi:hypothetical protein